MRSEQKKNNNDAAQNASYILHLTNTQGPNTGSTGLSSEQHKGHIRPGTMLANLGQKEFLEWHTSVHHPCHNLRVLPPA